MYKKVHKKESERNEDQVYSVKLALDKMKKIIKNVSENRKFMIEENEKIIDIVKRILYFNQLDQSRQGLKPNAQQITNFFSTIKSRKKF